MNAEATPLLQILVREIRADGPIGLDRYMALCLGHPSHGYYATRDPLGRGGDFVTAPEISQMFGELIGAWTASVLPAIAINSMVNSRWSISAARSRHRKMSRLPRSIPRLARRS